MTIQAQILELMQKLQHELGMAIIMITHDLGVVAQMCDEIVVMYAGSYCERGTADEIFYDPKHEYTKGLLRSIPTMGTMGQKLQPITGTPIDLLNLPKGCPFAPRCDGAMKVCIRTAPDSMEITKTHKASCWVNVERMMRDLSVDALHKAKKAGVSTEDAVELAAAVEQSAMRGSVLEAEVKIARTEEKLAEPRRKAAEEAQDYIDASRDRDLLGDAALYSSRDRVTGINNDRSGKRNSKRGGDK